MKYFILIFFSFSCGYNNREFSEKKDVIIETTELEFYINKFTELSGDDRLIEATGIIVHFDELEGRTAGICTLKGDSEPVIKIDRDYWENATEVAKENLMFHELGHCILRRGHLDDYIDKKPVSLMNSFLIPYYYGKDKQYYQEELYSITGDWIALTGNYHWTCGGQH